MSDRIRFRIGVTVLAVALGFTTPLLASPIVFNPDNAHYYTLTTGANDWEGAEAQAVSMAAHLVAVNNQAEQDFLVSVFLSGDHERSRYWIGATDKVTEGTFVWSNGDPLTYSNWENGEPNDCPQCNIGGEDYVAINWHYAGYQSGNLGSWNDTNVNSLPFGADPPVNQGIIEFDSNPNPVPEPSSIMLLGPAGLSLFEYLRRHRRIAAIKSTSGRPQNTRPS